MRGWVLAACLLLAVPRAEAAGDFIFADGFERGDFSLWSSSSTGGGDFSVTPTAAMGGTGKGAAAFVNDTGGLYAQDDTPADENEFRARFYLDPHDFDPGETQAHFRTRVYVLFEEAPTRRLMALVLKRQGGLYSLMARTRLDDNSFAQTPFFPIATGAHAVEIHWRRASGPDALDGLFELWIDGVSRSVLPGLDNNRSAVDFVRLGALSVKPGAAGTFYVDEYESRRNTYIGPCPAGNCPLVCPIGYDDCDLDVTDGCESLHTVDDCGTCGHMCTNGHGTTSCPAGACAPVCAPDYDSCDSDPSNGCETSLTTLATCGGCNKVCDLANASEVCGTGGTCTLDTCDPGFVNCDGQDATGCEVQNSGSSDTAPGEYLGSWDADSIIGYPFCGVAACQAVVTRTGTQGRFFSITAHEGSSCSGDLKMRVELTVPPGANYDLYVSAPPAVACNPFSCQSTGNGSDTVSVRATDVGGVDDSFLMQIEVRYVSGTSCQPWTLTIRRGDCTF